MVCSTSHTLCSTCNWGETIVHRERLTLRELKTTTLPRTSTSQTTREFEKRRVERERVRARNLLLFVVCSEIKKKHAKDWKGNEKKSRANRITHLGLSQSPRQTKKKDRSIDDVSIRFSFCVCVCVCVYVFVRIFFCVCIFQKSCF